MLHFDAQTFLVTGSYNTDHLSSTELRQLQIESVQGGLHLRPLHGHRAEPDPATEGPVRGASPGSERVLSAGGGEGGVH